MVVCAAAMFLIGVVDDVLNFKPSTKLIAEIAIASVLVFFGYRLGWTSSLTGDALLTLLWIGLFMVQPNTAKALLLFGDYKGTVKRQGLWWANPFLQKRSISLRVRNFETAKLKVNDHTGNPIEIGAVVVWQVVDTAESLFEVDDFENYVHVQSEAALRGLANQYAYVAQTDGEMALSSHTLEIAERKAFLRLGDDDAAPLAGVGLRSCRIFRQLLGTRVPRRRKI